MKKRSLVLVMTLLCLITLSGCSSLNGNVPFQYQPSLVSSNKTIKKSVGMNMLIDERPKKDAKYTKSIIDVPEKITSKILSDFKESSLFTDIHYPSQNGDDITITGTIDRFKWKLYAKPIVYIPYVNLIIYFGVPAQEAYGITAITLKVKNNTTGEILGTFSEESTVRTTYTLYDFKSGEAGSELSESFRNVMKKLKTDLLNLDY